MPASPHVSSVAIPSLIFLSFFFQHDFHFPFFLEEGFSLVLEDLAPLLGFGAGHGVVPWIAVGEEGVRSSRGLLEYNSCLPGCQGPKSRGFPYSLGST